MFKRNKTKQNKISSSISNSSFAIKEKTAVTKITTNDGDGRWRWKRWRAEGFRIWLGRSFTKAKLKKKIHLRIQNEYRAKVQWNHNIPYNVYECARTVFYFIIIETNFLWWHLLAWDIQFNGTKYKSNDFCDFNHAAHPKWPDYNSSNCFLLLFRLLLLFPLCSFVWFEFGCADANSRLSNEIDGKIDKQTQTIRYMNAT